MPTLFLSFWKKQHLNLLLVLLVSWIPKPDPHTRLSPVSELCCCHLLNPEGSFSSSFTSLERLPTPPEAASSTVPVIFLLFILPLIYLCMCLLPDFFTGEKRHEIKGHLIYLLLAPQCLQLFLALCLHYKYLLNA